MAKVKKLILISLVLRLVFAFAGGYHPDILNHLDWGLKFWEYGPKDFYEQIFWGLSWPNQPLGAIYLFGLTVKIYQVIFSFLWGLNLKIPAFPSFIFPFLEKKFLIVLLKLPFILADLGLGWLVYEIVLKLVKKQKPALLGLSLYLFNPIAIYNSAIWGQTDSLINFLALLGIWRLYQKKYFPGIFFFLAGFYFKLSLIIWLPAAGLIVFLNLKDWKKMIFPFFLSLLFFLLISLPFVHHGNVFSWLWYLYTNRVLPRQGEMLSGNAFNFWNLFYGLDLSLKETIPFLGTTAKALGRVIAFFLMALTTVFFLKKKKRGFSEFLFLMILYVFASFLFLTNMHERYLYPLFPPLTILAALKKVKFKYFLALSLIHLLNIYNLWNYPRIEILRLSLESENFLLTRILSLILILAFWKLFSFFASKKS